MTVLVSDPDLTIHVGDALETLRAMPADSVDCCVTSPPYWGLRDYGTGEWDGGDPDCDHAAGRGGNLREWSLERGYTGANKVAEGQTVPFKGACGKCGARRVDQQLGLEPTPEAYVANMVAVFQEVRRVLRPAGTLWLNLGDSYNGSSVAEASRRDEALDRSLSARTRPALADRQTRAPGLKPKDLVGIPWRVAFALQADGWYLRADIIWSKPNPMPESVTDRPTKAHEYVFLLSKQPRYWFDAEAVREPHAELDRTQSEKRRMQRMCRDVASVNGLGQSSKGIDGGAVAASHTMQTNPAGRNIRSVWEIATQPYAEAHFATFPEELVRRCLLAGCPEWVCGTCGKARERIVEREVPVDAGVQDGAKLKDNVPRHRGGTGRRLGQAYTDQLNANPAVTVGWSDCGHNNHKPGIVLDPFLGSGTTALVARKHGRACVGIELNPAYAELAARRTQQLSLLAEGTA